MKQIKHVRNKRLLYAEYTLLSGLTLYLVGLWCLASTNMPRPLLALPLPTRFLTGLGLMLLFPIPLIPLTLICTASLILLSKLSRPFSVAVVLAGLSAILVGALWVPNPFVLWPFSILGNAPVHELIGQLFTFHLVPSPEGSLDDAFRDLVRWQRSECAARLSILMIAWVACLVGIWMIHNHSRRTQSWQSK